MEQQAANTWRFYHADSGGSAVASTGVTVTTGWHWVELGWDGAQIQGRVDGAAMSAAAAVNPRRAGTDLRALRGGAFTSLGFDGDIAFIGIWKRFVPIVERDSIRANPWQLYQPTKRNAVFGAGGGAVSITLADASHAHTAENVVLTSSTGLTVADASHAHAADNITLNTTATVDLTVSDASHAQAAESVALSTDVALTVASAAHAQSADSVVVGAAETLTVANAAHAHSAGNVTLTVGGIDLTVADAAHAQAAGAPTLSADSFLITADGSHGQVADLVTLSTSVFFSVDSAAHAQTADNLSLDGAPTLAVNGAQHAQAADGVALALDSWLESANATHAQTAQNIMFGGAVSAVRGSLVGRGNMQSAPAVRKNVQTSKR